MASRKIDDLHPVLAYAFGKAEAAWSAQYPNAPKPFIVCTNRPNEEQDALFKAKPKPKLTNACAGESPHNYLPALAFDVAFKFKNGAVTYDTKWFDQFAPFVLATAGITWGGNFKSFKDKPHYELTAWRVLDKKL
jgi:peptidoglycan L-alanyl-D-glutamate endopeptidase CwlK